MNVAASFDVPANWRLSANEEPTPLSSLPALPPDPPRATLPRRVPRPQPRSSVPVAGVQPAATVSIRFNDTLAHLVNYPGCWIVADCVATSAGSDQ